MRHYMRCPEACRYAGGEKPLCEKLVYAAVRAGKLKVARIGSGRNWVTTAEWVDEWLSASSRPQTEPQVLQQR